MGTFFEERCIGIHAYPSVRPLPCGIGRLCSSNVVYRHAVQHLQEILDPEKNPGLNGSVSPQSYDWDMWNLRQLLWLNRRPAGYWVCTGVL